MKKTALVIIDMQNDVLEKLVKTGGEIVPAIKIALDAFRKKGAAVIYLVREHRASGVDVELFRVEKFQEHPFLVKGTKGAGVVEALKPLEGEPKINKKRFSGFFQSDLLMVLTRLQIDSLVICGVQTPNCIRATVTDALAYDFEVKVLEDATAAQTPEVHQANLFDMRNMGAEIIKLDAFLETF